MKKIIILCIIPLFFGFKSGQEIDENKMNRDLEIAKNIIATLIKTDANSFFGGNSIEASYIKGYGVVFTIPEHMVFFHGGSGNFFVMPEIPEIPEMEPFEMEFHFESEDGTDLFEQEEQFRVQNKARLEQDKARMEQEKEKAEQEMEMAREQANIARREAERAQRDVRVTINKNKDQMRTNSEGAKEIDWENIMVTFLTDYADLIGQLQPEEKIVINQKSPNHEIRMIWNDDNGQEVINEANGNTSAEVLRKDIQSYKSGKINKEDFVKRIVISTKTPAKKNPDLEMFTSILDRYYSRELSETYFAEGKPAYEVLDGFGAIVRARMFTPGKGNTVYFYDQGKNWTSDQKENPQDDEKLYHLFKENMKSFMLDYGRTVRSLGDKDKLRMEINIQACRDCKVPKMLEISTEMSVLEQYDQQKISKEKALEAMEIKERF